MPINVLCPRLHGFQSCRPERSSSSACKVTGLGSCRVDGRFQHRYSCSACRADPARQSASVRQALKFSRMKCYRCIEPGILRYPMAIGIRGSIRRAVFELGIPANISTQACFRQERRRCSRNTARCTEQCPGVFRSLQERSRMNRGSLLPRSRYAFEEATMVLHFSSFKIHEALRIPFFGFSGSFL